MNKTIVLSLFFFISVCPQSYGQTSKAEIYNNPCKSGGVYYAYQAPEKVQTPVPAGYQAFYISMYGRHGSRYLLGDNDYTEAINLFGKAHDQKALTPLGENVLQRLKAAYAEAKGRGGDLSPLGVRQYRGIAERMYRAFPSVFADSSAISARSTMVIRSIFSMDAFCERLKELNPKLRIPRDATNRDAGILNFHTQRSDAFNSESGPWNVTLQKFEKSVLKPQRLVGSLFKAPAFVSKNVNPTKLMWSLYWIASDTQDTEAQISFYDVFDKEELFDLWQCFNAKFYMACGLYDKNYGIPLDNEKPLLRDIVKQASTYIRDKKCGATFYFGHDMNLMRLTALMKLEACEGQSGDIADFYKVWSDFKIAPMAANLQLVFYRNPSTDDILVKFMLNEQERRLPITSDQSPYYHWNDVVTYLNKAAQN